MNAYILGLSDKDATLDLVGGKVRQPLGQLGPAYDLASFVQQPQQAVFQGNEQPMAAVPQCQLQQPSSVAVGLHAAVLKQPLQTCHQAALQPDRGRRVVGVKVLVAAHVVRCQGLVGTHHPQQHGPGATGRILADERVPEIPTSDDLGRQRDLHHHQQ